MVLVVAGESFCSVHKCYFLIREFFLVFILLIIERDEIHV